MIILIVKILIAVLGALTAIVFLFLGMKKSRRRFVRTGVIISIGSLATIIAISIAAFIIRS